MTFYVDKSAKLFDDVNIKADEFFDIDDVTKQVISAVMDSVNCPYEVQVDILITDDDGIKRINKKTRSLNEPTDVLSFPATSYNEPANFEEVLETVLGIDPDSGELLLGDIIISAERLREQAASYNHSLKREYAFLLTHSLLHLLGYDHLDKESATLMEFKQETILQKIGISRGVNER